jgi:hypothetical protein
MNAPTSELQQLPPQTQPFAPPVVIQFVPPPPRRRRRWWLWGGLITLALVVGVAGIVVLDRVVLTHHLLKAEFTSAADPFKSGETGDYRFGVVQGTYQIQSKIAPSSPAEAYAWFVRTAYNVDVSADVIAVEDPTGRAIVGVGCFDSPSDNDHGYVFLVGAQGYALMTADLPLNDVLATLDKNHEWPPGGQRLGISCSPTSPVGSTDVEVRGYINGTEVISAADAGGFDTYRSVVLYLATEQAGVSVRFDNVTATVPGE